MRETPPVGNGFSLGGVLGLHNAQPPLIIARMIKSFGHKGLQRFHLTGDTSGVQAKHIQKLADRLDMLDAAETITDMAKPGWRLHPLKGGQKGHLAVSVSGNWRLTFAFSNGNAYTVNYEDYH